MGPPHGLALAGDAPTVQKMGYGIRTVPPLVSSGSLATHHGCTGVGRRSAYATTETRTAHEQSVTVGVEKAYSTVCDSRGHESHALVQLNIRTRWSGGEPRSTACNISRVFLGITWCARRVLSVPTVIFTSSLH